MAGMAAPRTADERAMPRPVTLLSGPRPFVVIGLAIAALLTLGMASLMYGAIQLTPGEAWSGLTSDSNAFARNVVWQIRYPRVLDGLLVGACLAVAGNLLQGVTRNPLADPTILGVTAASGLAASTIMVVDAEAPQWAVAAVAVGGALVGAGLLFIISWRGAISPVRLALAGVAMSAFFGAIIVGLLSSSRAFLQSSLGFLAGGLYGSAWADWHAMLPYAIAGLLVAMLLAGRLNVLALGDDVAAGLGLLTDRTRLLILAVSAVLTAAAVSTAGMVSFVGLVCPHLAKFTVGGDNRLTIPVSALYGAILVVGADLFARLIISPSEIPMGIVTAAVGAPFLLYLVKFKG